MDHKIKEREVEKLLDIMNQKKKLKKSVLNDKFDLYDNDELAIVLDKSD